MSSKLFENWSETKPLEKFNRILSNANFIRFNNYNSQDERKHDILEILLKIEELRYQLSHNKATESTTSNLDRVLASTALDMALLIYERSDLKKFVDGVLYYEKNEDLRGIYLRMLH